MKDLKVGDKVKVTEEFIEEFRDFYHKFLDKRVEDLYEGQVFTVLEARRPLEDSDEDLQWVIIDDHYEEEFDKYWLELVEVN